jgi:hypothetical protein
MNMESEAGEARGVYDRSFNGFFRVSWPETMGKRNGRTPYPKMFCPSLAENQSAMRN